MDTQGIILFDTDVTIDFLRRNPEIVAIANDLGTEHLFINSIIRMEVLYKAVDKKDLIKIKRLMEGLPSIPFDDAISDIFEDIFEEYILSHRPTIPDMIIAATCLYYDIPLFTFNKKHFQYIKGVNLIPHDLKPLPRKSGSWFG